MTWMTASKVRGMLTRTAVAAAIAGAAASGAIAAAISTPAPALQADPGCDAFGWRHPLCGGGAWDQSASTEAGLDAAQEPSIVPNIDGSLSPPGTPGAI
ncbi:MAG: hypothetical protein ACXWZR_04125 [Mycobacterium sp.]